MARYRTSHLWRTQNFIRRPRLVDQLLENSDIGPVDVVYEIGAGTGVITDRLAARCRRVVAIEKDPRLCALLRERFSRNANVVVRCADFLAYPLPRRPYKVFANPPFEVTTALVTKLVSASRPPGDTYLAVQNEAAKRFLGMPRETLYALLLKPWFAPSIVHRFRRDDFVPAPGVDVVMLRLKKRDPPLVRMGDARLYRDFVVACFTAWQPSTGGALARLFGRTLASSLVSAAGIDPTVRASRIRFGSWLRLFRSFAGLADQHARHKVFGAERRLRRHQSDLRKPTRTPLRVGSGNRRSSFTPSSDERSPPLLASRTCYGGKRDPGSMLLLGPAEPLHSRHAARWRSE